MANIDLSTAIIPGSDPNPRTGFLLIIGSGVIAMAGVLRRKLTSY